MKNKTLYLFYIILSCEIEPLLEREHKASCFISERKRSFSDREPSHRSVCAFFRFSSLRHRANLVCFLQSAYILLVIYQPLKRQGFISNLGDSNKVGKKLGSWQIQGLRNFQEICPRTHLILFDGEQYFKLDSFHGVWREVKKSLVVQHN